MYQTFLKTPIGTLQLFADDNALFRIVFPGCGNNIPSAETAPQKHPLLAEAARQISDYLTGQRQRFELPLAPRGTPFQLAAWQIMQQIPFGDTLTYGEVAARLGNRNKARGVGGAANSNPLPLVIPCHRVMGAGGRLTGFAGGLSTKQFLLNLESGIKRNYSNTTCWENSTD